MDFRSDNIVGASAPILRAILEANEGAAAAYGADPFSIEAGERMSRLFERDVATFLLPTGTASNALALAALAPPGTAVFCHEEAHVIDDECGAPEFFTGGAKLVGIPGEGGKIVPAALQQTLDRFPRNVVRQVPAAALSLSQATESGTAYTPDEVGALARMAHGAGLGVHMDGARFANALTSLGATPAEMTWKAGVDVLSFGATKNGALACEAVVLFDPSRASDFAFRRKRGGHTLSKGRLLGAQMVGYLANDHWLDLARRANESGQRLARGLRSVPGVHCPWPTEANEVFAVLPRSADLALRAAGAYYYEWSVRSLSPAQRPGASEIFARFVCSFATPEADIDRGLQVIRAAVAAGSQ